MCERMCFAIQGLVLVNGEKPHIYTLTRTARRIIRTIVHAHVQDRTRPSLNTLKNKTQIHICYWFVYLKTGVWMDLYVIKNVRVRQELL